MQRIRSALGAILRLDHDTSSQTDLRVVDPSDLPVVDPALPRIEISPYNLHIAALGDSMQHEILAKDASGTRLAGHKPFWTINSPRFAKVGGRGMLMSIAVGFAIISASCDSVADTIGPDVTQVVAGVTLSEAVVTTTVNGTKKLSATANDTKGKPIKGASFNWTSSDTLVAEVDRTGKVRGSSPGRAVITATSGEQSDSTTVTVTAEPVPATGEPVPATGEPVPATGSAGDLVVYPSAAIEFILGPQLRSGTPANPWRWFDTNAIDRGHYHGREFPMPAQVTDPDYYINLNYYDQGLVQYLNYYRTGDAAFLGYARKIADSWWERQTQSGRIGVEDSMAPRNIALGGLILRALDGKPEMWPWITDYTRTVFQMWVGARVTYDSPYYGVRDGAYMLQYAAWLARVHPDAAVRAEFEQKALLGARDYYVRIQAADGAWYWNDEGNVWEQPFMVGLLLDALITTHRLTGDTAIRGAILKSVDHLYRVYRLNDIVPERLDLRWRSMPYFVFPDGRTQGETNLDGGWDLNTIREGRQRNVLVVQAYGYAYQLTKDPKYRQWGDEIFASTYGRTAFNLSDQPLSPQGPLADGMSSLADFRAKEYNQSYRSAGRYLAWRLD